MTNDPTRLIKGILCLVAGLFCLYLSFQVLTLAF